MSEEQKEAPKLTNQEILNIFEVYDIAIKAPGTNHEAICLSKISLRNKFIEMGLIKVNGDN